MRWKSTSLYGCEYLIVLRGPVFESYVCQIVCYLIDYYFNNTLDHDE